MSGAHIFSGQHRFQRGLQPERATHAQPRDEAQLGEIPFGDLYQPGFGQAGVAAESSAVLQVGLDREPAQGGRTDFAAEADLIGERTTAHSISRLGADIHRQGIERPSRQQPDLDVHISRAQRRVRSSS